MHTLYDVCENGESLTPVQVDALMKVLGKGLRDRNKRRLRSVLTYGLHAVEKCGILERVYIEGDDVLYCACQSYPDEIRIIRQVLLGQI